MKVSELKELAVDELQRKEQDLRKELFNLRFQQATGEIENPMRIRAIRKRHRQGVDADNREERDEQVKLLVIKIGLEG